MADSDSRSDSVCVCLCVEDLFSLAGCSIEPFLGCRSVSFVAANQSASHGSSSSAQQHRQQQPRVRFSLFSGTHVKEVKKRKNERKLDVPSAIWQGSRSFHRNWNWNCGTQLRLPELRALNYVRTLCAACYLGVYVCPNSHAPSSTIHLFILALALDLSARFIKTARYDLPQC